MSYRYLLSDIDFGDEEVQAVSEVVKSKWLSLGPRTEEFEQRFARWLGAPHAVAVSSCTAALHLALAALDVGPGDEVLLPSYTFVATANVVLHQGATPVFVDINGSHDLNLDVADLVSKITPRTKAIMVVHLAGFPAEMDEIIKVARRHNLAVIEDACHAIGADYLGTPGGKHAPAPDSVRGQKAGTLGDVGCFSFFANKNLVTGEGGMLVCRDAAVAQRVRLARSHGMTKSSWDKAEGRAVDYDVTQPGFNYRCTELTAAIGLVQLGKLPAANAKRRELVARYRRQLAPLREVVIPFADRLQDSAHHIFPIVLSDASAREGFRKSLKERGVQTSLHYPPVHLFSHYRQHPHPQTDLERTCDVAAREVTLPLHPLLSYTDIDAICDAVAASLRPANSPQASRRRPAALTRET